MKSWLPTFKIPTVDIQLTDARRLLVHRLDAALTFSSGWAGTVFFFTALFADVVSPKVLVIHLRCCQNVPSIIMEKEGLNTINEASKKTHRKLLGRLLSLSILIHIEDIDRLKLGNLDNGKFPFTREHYHLPVPNWYICKFCFGVAWCWKQRLQNKPPTRHTVPLWVSAVVRCIYIYIYIAQ